MRPVTAPRPPVSRKPATRRRAAELPALAAGGEVWTAGHHRSSLPCPVACDHAMRLSRCDEAPACAMRAPRGNRFMERPRLDCRSGRPEWRRPGSSGRDGSLARRLPAPACSSPSSRSSTPSACASMPGRRRGRSWISTSVSCIRSSSVRALRCGGDRHLDDAAARPAGLVAGLDAPLRQSRDECCDPLGTDYEMAWLFREHVGAPTRVIWGIDTTWCEADATDEGKRLTPRQVPTCSPRGRLERLARAAQPDQPGDLPAGSWPSGSAGRASASAATATRSSHRRRRRRPLAGPAAISCKPRRHGFRSLTAVAAGRRSRRRRAPPGASRPCHGWRRALPLSRRRRGVMLVLPPAHGRLPPREGSAAWQRYAGCKVEIAALAHRQRDGRRLRPCLADHVAGR